MRSARAARAGADCGEDAYIDRVDERVSALLQWLASAHAEQRVGAVRRVLDIGCNAAKPLIELCQFANPPLEKAIGVDIDEELVQHAKTAVRAAWSQMQPDRHGDTEAVYYFPACFAGLMGSLPLPPPESHGFPQCLSLHVGDWVNAPASTAAEDAKGYDLILCLSLTKWIHLNQGDAGLVRLCMRIAKCLTPGGILAMEIQPWRSYDQARSLSRALRLAYSSLRLRPADIEYILTWMGLDPLGPIAYGTGYGR